LRSIFLKAISKCHSEPSEEFQVISAFTAIARDVSLRST
jgi:hypothetical protein